MPNGNEQPLYPGQMPELASGKAGKKERGQQMSELGGFIPERSPYIYAPAFNVPHYQDTRGSYLDLIEQLRQQSAGEGPTVAEKQHRQMTDRNVSQLMSAMASGAGYQPSGATQRAASQQAAGARQQGVMDSSILRAQEMLAGRQALGGALQQMSGLDLSQMQAQMGLQQILAEGQRTYQQRKTEQRGQTMGFIGSMFSDKDLKKNIVESEVDIHQFLDFLGDEYA